MPLQISIRSDKLLDAAADVVVLGIWVSSNPKKAAYSDVVLAADRALGGGLLKVLAKEEFTGKRDQMVSVATFGRLPATRLVLLGLGERAAARDPEVRAFAAKAARAALGEKAKTLILGVPGGVEARLRAVAEGLELGAYRFSKYFTGDRKPKDLLEQVAIVTDKKVGSTAKKDVALGQLVAAGVNLSRDLSNEPPNVLTPAALAGEAQKMAKQHGLKIQVFDYKEIVRRGMSLIDAVGRGSRNEPPKGFLSP